MLGKSSKTLQALITIVFLISLLGPASLPAASASAAKAHPLLLELAERDPKQMVLVIVQKLARDSRLEAWVAAHGGVVTKDLSLINAFAAELSAGEAVQLAHDPQVRWVSPDAPVEKAGKPTPPPPPPTINTYLETLRVPQVWQQGRDGSGIGVAVIDSGISNHIDLSISYRSSFNPNATSVVDRYGHGTHVAGILAGSGALSSGAFKGVAPGVTLIGLRVNDDSGMASESDVVAAMQWVYNNKAQHNIRVVNLSLNSTVEQSYMTSPMNAAAEILWFNGVVVVVSSGNSTSGINYANTPPANDPFVITVGAADEKATEDPADDTIATYTSWTVTANGFLKPDIFAPGTNIISTLSGNSDWDIIAPERVVNTDYFRLSGTSMAAPMVTGAVALLLQGEPNLTPDQVKHRLLNSSGRQLSIYIKPTRTTYYFPYLDVYNVVNGTTTTSSNTGVTANQLLWTGTNPVTWNSVSWNSVSWNSVSWNSVSWNSVSWNSVSWNSAYWGP